MKTSPIDWQREFRLPKWVRGLGAAFFVALYVFAIAVSYTISTRWTSWQGYRPSYFDGLPVVVWVVVILTAILAVVGLITLRGTRRFEQMPVIAGLLGLTVLVDKIEAHDPQAGLLFLPIAAFFGLTVAFWIYLTVTERIIPAVRKSAPSQVP